MPNTRQSKNYHRLRRTQDTTVRNDRLWIEFNAIATSIKAGSVVIRQPCNGIAMPDHAGVPLQLQRMTPPWSVPTRAQRAIFAGSALSVLLETLARPLRAYLRTEKTSVFNYFP